MGTVQCENSLMSLNIVTNVESIPLLTNWCGVRRSYLALKSRSKSVNDVDALLQGRCGVAHLLSDPQVMGSTSSTAYFHITVHQPSAS